MDFADVCSMQEIELGARRAMRIRELTVVATATQRRANQSCRSARPDRPSHCFDNFPFGKSTIRA